MSYIPAAIDLLLKKEFDIHRQNATVHLIVKIILIIIPFKHDNIEEWQNNRKGIRYHHEDTNLIIYGAIDDCWRDDNNVLHIVDYKSTTASYDPKTLEIKPVNLDEKGAPHKYWCKKQVEIYRWLFSKNNFDVSNTTYFVFASALHKNVEAFNKKLDFKIDIIFYDGDHSWMDNTIIKIKETLESNIPEEIKLYSLQI